MKNSKWWDISYNPVTGCTPVSAGCDHCYAKRLAGRFPQIHGQEFDEHLPERDFVCDIPFGKIQFHHDRLDIPLHWRKPKRIFVSSMGDLFHPDVSPKFVHDVFDVILRCPQHTFIILTKRPENILAKLPPDYGTVCGGILPNLWLGVTAENQEMLDLRWSIASKIPAVVLFVSGEPLLGNIDFLKHDRKPDWFIVGPETGPGARPMNLDWARSLRDQCVAADVPFFYKRGELDGRLWHQFPKGE